MAVTAAALQMYSGSGTVMVSLNAANVRSLDACSSEAYLVTIFHHGWREWR